MRIIKTIITTLLLTGVPLLLAMFLYELTK